MKLIFAPDSFKGSLSAVTCCDILERTAMKVFPDVTTVSVPMADGGEGTVDALLRAVGGRRIQTQVTDPLFAPITAEWGMLNDGSTAVLEMAQASGLPCVPFHLRDPRRTTSLGTGQLIAEALRQGAKEILLGIGGSATNDGGMGMLSALGAVFTDREGRTLIPTGGALAQVEQVNLDGLLPQLSTVKITVICDVVNPLLGDNGATLVYAPQKGATPAIVDELELGMTHYARIMREKVGCNIADFPGAGAAGGMGAALGGVLRATLKRGIDAVLDAVDFDSKLVGVSLAVTGEGRIDRQSVRYGKVPLGVAKRCTENGIPVAVLAGGIGDGAEELFDLCESTIHTIAPGPINLKVAMADASNLYEQAAERLFRTIRIGMRLK